MHFKTFLASQILEEFYNIFGPELKAVTSETKKIEEVLQRVDALVQPLKDVRKISFISC